MQAAVGDRLHVRANIVGNPERKGEIVEVRGAGGEPPYLVRFDDGHTALIFPGPTRSSSIRAGNAGKGRPKASPRTLPGPCRSSGRVCGSAGTAAR
jgi:Domain of unknown function (DUF1918)